MPKASGRQDAGPNVFLLPRHPTSWAELIPVARHVNEAGRLRPITILANEFTASQKAALESAGLPYINLHDAIERRLAAADNSTPRLGTPLKRAAEHAMRLRFALPLELLKMRELRRRLATERAVFREALRCHSAKAVLLPGDRELSPVPSMLRACRDEGVPTLIAASNLPYTGGLEVTRLDDIGHRIRLREGAPLLSVLAAHKFPGQVLSSPYGNLLFSPGWRTFALSAEGMLPHQPWIQGGGLSDYILQHNRSKLSEYKRRGLDDRKIVFIGDITLDPLHRSLTRRHEIRQRLNKAYGADDSKPLVVMAVPNEAEHGLCDWPTHLARQESFWKLLGAQRATVVLSLHPKSRQQDYQELAGRCGFHFADARLHDILPAADLFVCSCSTTCLWAKLCGIPIVNLDYLRLHLDYFREEYGVFEVSTPEDFAAVLPAALTFRCSPDWAGLQRQTRRTAEETVFDGKAMARLERFLDRLASGERPRGPIWPAELESETSAPTREAGPRPLQCDA